MSLEGFHENMMIAYLRGDLLDARPQAVNGVWWADARYTGTSRSRTPHKALLTLATTYFGQAHDLTKREAILYTDVLAGLRADLADSRVAWSFGTLAATTTLSMYEAKPTQMCRLSQS